MNLKEIENKAWKSNYQDGLVDIQIGLIFIVGSICQIFDVSRYYYPLFLVPAIIYVIAKKYIIAPRMGLVKFGRKRKKRNYILYSVMTASILFLLFLTVTAKTSFIPNAFDGAIVVSSIILLITLSIAFFLDFSRMYIYSVLITLSFIANEIIIDRTGVISNGAYAYLFSSVIMLSVGVVLFRKFLQEYPFPAEEAGHES